MGAENEGKHFSGGDGKFSYKNALKAKSGQKKKKILNLGPSQGLSLPPLLEGFPPLGSKSPGPSVENTSTVVAAVATVEDSEKEVDLEATKATDGNDDDVQSEEEHAKSEGNSGEIINHSREGNPNDDVQEEIDGEEGEEDDEEEEDDDDGEDDISRYQREIQEQHMLKEGQGLRTVLTTQSTSSSSEAMDDLLISSLLKVRTCKYDVCCSICKTVWKCLSISLFPCPIQFCPVPSYPFMLLSYLILFYLIFSYSCCSSHVEFYCLLFFLVSFSFCQVSIQISYL